VPKNVDPLDVIEELRLSNDKNDREAVKNGVKKPPPLPSPILKSPEIKRTFNLGTILAEAASKVFKREKEDTFGATATTAEKAKQVALKADEKKKKPFKFPLLATLAAGITAFAAWIAGFIGPVAEFIAKTLPKLLKPMGAMAKTLFMSIKGGKLMAVLKGISGKFGPKLLRYGRFIPVIGSLFSFGFGIARWKKGEYIPAIFEFLSGILNLLPTGYGNLASMLIDGGLLLYDLDKQQEEKEKLDPTGQSFDMWDKIRMYFLGSPGIQNIISLGKAIGAVFRGEWKEAGDHFLESLPVIGTIIHWLNKAESGNVHAQEMIGTASNFFITIKEKVVDVVTTMVTSILDWIGEQAGNVGEMLGDLGGGALEGLKNLGSALNPFDDFMVRGDKVIPFNTKDDVIGMKDGGALSNVFKSIQGSIQQSDKKIDQQKGFLNKALTGVDSIRKDIFSGASSLTKDFKEWNIHLKEIKTSNQHLGQIVQLTSQLVAGQGQNAAPTPNIGTPQQGNDMSGSMDGPAYPDGRFDYTNSAYAMSTT